MIYVGLVYQQCAFHFLPFQRSLCTKCEQLSTIYCYMHKQLYTHIIFENFRNSCKEYCAASAQYSLHEFLCSKMQRTDTEGNSASHCLPCQFSKVATHLCRECEQRHGLQNRNVNWKLRRVLVVYSSQPLYCIVMQRANATL